jgi:hypothetical protein
MPARRPEADAALAGPADAFGWFFRNRRTGAITIGQWPNAPLLIVAACATLGWVFDPPGVLGTAIRVVGWGSLACWAGDEILRGVNPWRRCLGAAVLLYGAYALLA